MKTKNLFVEATIALTAVIQKLMGNQGAADATKAVGGLLGK